MTLVKAKCPHCQYTMPVNPEVECIVCPNCGAPFIVAKAIDAFNADSKEGGSKNSAKPVVSGKNIDSLVARGMELLAPVKIREEGKTDPKDVERKRIANEILDIDHKNFYGRLFLIDSGDYAPENFTICQNVQGEKEKKMYANYLVDAIKWKLSFMENIQADLLHLQIQSACDALLSSGLHSLREMAPFDDDINKQYDEIGQWIEDNFNKVLLASSDLFCNFYYSKDNLNSYEFKSLCELASYLGVFNTSIKEIVINQDAIYRIGERICNAVNPNAEAIMKYNSIYGKHFLEDCYKLAGKEYKSSEMAEISKFTLSGLWASKRKTTMTFYPDKVIMNIDGVEPRTILVKDILFMNLTQSNTSALGLIVTTLWYDIVYKLSPTTYTLIHFGYDMKTTESFFDCEVYQSIQSWAITNDVRHTDTKYDRVNPFEGGYNGLAYVDTQPPLGKTGGCYVATCVYGSYDCPQVWTLRRYRDYYLDERWWGRLFIKVYYFVSPKIIKLFGKTKWFNKLNKSILDKKYHKLLNKGYQNTRYQDKY